MAILPILCYPDPRLHTVARTVDAVNERVRELTQSVIARLYARGIKAAVIASGLMALSGRIQWMTFIGVMLAVVIIFGSAGIVDYIRDNSATAALDPAPVFAHVV